MGDYLWTSKGRVPVECLIEMRNKDLPTNPVVSLSDLQRACHRIAQLLDLRGYKIEIYKPQRISIRNPNIYSNIHNY